MILRIHNYDVLDKCIEDILLAIKPVKDDRNKRLYAIQELNDSINLVGALRVKPFGSFVSNLYAKSGDLDVSVDLWSGSDIPTSKKRKQNVLRELMRALQIRGVATSMKFIPNARVPVLQYMSNHFGISCDISINNYPGQTKSRILYWINTIDSRFGDIVLLVKEWAKAQNINDPKNGTLNSYSLCLLVLFHFQTCEPAILPPLKEIYDGNVAEDIAGRFYCNEKRVDEVCEANIRRFLRQNMRQRNQSSVSELLASFFHKFYCIGKLSDQVISTYTGKFERIQGNRSWMAKPHRLFIEDPFERPDNAARAVGEDELPLIGRAFNYVSYKFTAGALNDRNELLSLLCTRTVRSIRGDRVRASRYTNATPNQQYQQARSLTGSRSARTSERSIGGQRAQPSSEHMTAGHVYSTRGESAVAYQYHDDLRSYAARRRPASQYQNQHGRREYSPYQSASTTWYEPVGRRFHNGPAWDYGS